MLSKLITKINRMELHIEVFIVAKIRNIFEKMLKFSYFFIVYFHSSQNYIIFDFSKLKYLFSRFKSREK